MIRAAIALVLLAPVAAQAQETRAQWTVMSLRIEKSLPDKLLPRYNPVGTTLTLLVRLPGKEILYLDAKASKLASAVDDKGTDLAKRPVGAIQDGVSFRQPLMAGSLQSLDYCPVSLQIPNYPALGAIRLRFKGTGVLQCGGKMKTVEARNVKLEVKAVVKIGPVDVAPTGNSLGSIGAKSQQGIKSIEFIDAGGAELKKSQGFHYIGGDGPTPHHYVITNLTDGSKCNLIRVCYFETQERLDVPFDVETGLGLR